MATKYEKLEAEYNLLTTPEQQWAWVLAHKDEEKVVVNYTDTFSMCLKNGNTNKTFEIGEWRSPYGQMLILLSVLGIEVEDS